MITKRQQGGYMMLLTVIAFGVVSIGVAVSAVLLGLKATQTSFAKEKYHQARANANACAEDAIIQLRADLSVLPVPPVLEHGSCTIALSGNLATNGAGEIRVTGISEEDTWRIKLTLARVLPQTTITSWQEVSSF